MDRKSNYVFRSVVCYFCNEQFPEEQLQDHVKQCSLVLEPCERGCAAWLQRRHLELHAAECPRKKKNSTSSLQQNTHISGPSGDDDYTEYAPTLVLLQQSVSSLRSAFNEELRQRLKMITDLGQLQKRFQQSESWSTDVQGVLDTLRRSLDRIVHDNESARVHNHTNVEKIAMRCQLFEEWKMEVDMRLDGLRNMILDEENQRNQVEVVLNGQDKKLRRVNELAEQDMDLIRQSVIQLQKDAQKTRREVASNFYEDHTKTADELDKQKARIASFLYELKSMKSTVQDNTDILDKLSRQLVKQERLVAQLSQQIKDAEDARAFHKALSEPVNGTGHMVWRIENYKEKLTDAKANKTILSSPTFCSTKFGYVLRMELHINGNGKWRGRHMTCGLQVLPGPWDSILPWPCVLPVEVTLRNQSKNPEVKNVTKTLMAKRSEPSNTTEAANQLVFFPHEMVKQEGYVVNDVMFLEVRVRKQKRDLK
ncbi:TNF receptor-associated factor 3 [Ctenocephalides felis]|uniref:TNF receptor-associated factor 3 n=1 Tax=Ctenocephalides felis TaxID=7515 RepID=UPI000E6E2217|nr:TNF receptor-associated factor 3 [Ctenocephalides felis]